MARTVCISLRNLVASILFIAKNEIKCYKGIVLSSVLSEIDLRSQVMYCEGGRRREKEGTHLNISILLNPNAILPLQAFEGRRTVILRFFGLEETTKDCIKINAAFKSF